MALPQCVPNLDRLQIYVFAFYKRHVTDRRTDRERALT